MHAYYIKNIFFAKMDNEGIDLGDFLPSRNEPLCYENYSIRNFKCIELCLF